MAFSPSATGSVARLSAEEIRLRGMLLASNKDLLKLHRELVMTGMVMEEEFWENRKAMLSNQATLNLQKKAASSALASDVKPAANALGDVKYVLTPSIIQSIFHQNPKVLQAYQDNVPEKMSEKEFWTEYFKSKYFQRDALPPSATDKPSTNVLDKYFDDGDVGDEEVRVPESGISRLVDIAATAEDHFSDYYQPESQSARLSRGDLSLALIRKFNRHSQGVLQSDRGSIRSSGFAWPLEKAVELGDLSAVVEPKPIPLEIEDQSKYFERSIQQHRKQAHFVEDELEASPRETMAQWRPDPAFVDDMVMDYPTYARKLSRLSATAGSVDAKVGARHALVSVKSEDVISWHTSVIEVLSHFWSAANSPPKSTDRVERMTRMVAVLRTLQQNLVGWIDSASLEESIRIQEMCQPTIRSIERAVAKHGETMSQSENKRQRLS